MTGRWDLLVLGGGTAGLVAAVTGAELGARVALVERDRTGGECLYTGCVPSKALVAAAAAARAARTPPAWVTGVGEVGVDGRAVMRRVREAIATIEPHDSPDMLREAGVEVLTGDAAFTAPDAVEVAGHRHRFARAVLAAGSEPVVPDVPGLAAARPLTTDTLWDLEDLPERLLVLGGGAIGCEIGQATARLGCRVTLVEPGPRLLGTEDPDAAALVRAALEADGVDVRTGHTLREVTTGSTPRIAVLDPGDGAGLVEVPLGAVLVAAGRRPRTAGLGLEAAGIEAGEDGVRVDARLRTTNPRVWAAGDVTPHAKLTHLAAAHGGTAAAGALLGLPLRAVAGAAVPRVTYTDPEVASVGDPTWAEGGGAPPRTVTQEHAEVDRGVTDGRTDGFTRLRLGAGGRVTGATVVGPRAGESVAELVLALRVRQRLTGLATTVHAYPTYGYGPGDAALGELRRRAARWRLRRLTGLVVRLRLRDPRPAHGGASR